MTRPAQAPFPPHRSTAQEDWWRGAVIYQIYPRSFYDSNGDGIGDLPGVTAKLDYVASLGVDAIWVSPFFTSPMKDFGYDISDTRGVDPIFGTLEDFDELVAQAHARELRVMIDLVPSHTSDQHPWFQQSREDRVNDKADWYVWADARADGSPPNNWLSVFGGPAWTWNPRRRQYYLHQFLSSQPDINFHHPEAVDAVLADVEFWLQRGVDGLRLDSINHCTHDRLLRNNPPRTVVAEGSIGVRPDNPYAFQLHVHDKTQPENLDFLRRLRALLNRYPGTASLGEIGDDNALRTMAEYTRGGDKLHMAYSFDLLTSENSADYLRRTLGKVEQALADGWPCWALGNHDVARVVSRWNAATPAQQKLYLLLLLTLRGSCCLYQGDELGLAEAQLRYEDLVDPYGINFWPEYAGRDGCRTPMPWVPDAEHAGFSLAKPWLPVYADHYAQAVAAQDADPESVLNAYRALLRWRRSLPALVKGDIAFRDSPADSLLYERQLDGERLIIALNLSDRPLQMPVPPATQTLSDALPLQRGHWLDGQVRLPAYGAWVGRLGEKK